MKGMKANVKEKAKKAAVRQSAGTIANGSAGRIQAGKT